MHNSQHPTGTFNRQCTGTHSFDFLVACCLSYSRESERHLSRDLLSQDLRLGIYSNFFPNPTISFALMRGSWESCRSIADNTDCRSHKFDGSVCDPTSGYLFLVFAAVAMSRTSSICGRSRQPEMTCFEVTSPVSLISNVPTRLHG